MIKISEETISRNQISRCPQEISNGITTLFYPSDLALFDLLNLNEYAYAKGSLVIDKVDVFENNKEKKVPCKINITSNFFSISCVYLANDQGKMVNDCLLQELEKVKKLPFDSADEKTAKIDCVMNIILNSKPSYVIIDFLDEKNQKNKQLIKNALLIYKDDLIIIEYENQRKNAYFENIVFANKQRTIEEQEEPLFSNNFRQLIYRNLLNFIFIFFFSIVAVVGLSLFSYSLLNGFFAYAEVGLIFGALGILFDLFFIHKFNESKNPQYNNKQEKHTKMICLSIFVLASSLAGLVGVYFMAKLDIIFVYANMTFVDYIAPVVTAIILVVYSLLSFHINDFVFKMVNNIKKKKRKPINGEVKKHNKNQKDQLDD